MRQCEPAGVLYIVAVNLEIRLSARSRVSARNAHDHSFRPDMVGRARTGNLVVVDLNYVRRASRSPISAARPGAVAIARLYLKTHPHRYVIDHVVVDRCFRDAGVASGIFILTPV